MDTPKSMDTLKSIDNPRYVSVRFRDTYLTQLLELLFTAKEPYSELNNIAVGLIDYGADVSRISDSALKYAVEKEDLLLIKYLIGKGVKPSNAIINFAAEQGKPDIFTTLLNGIELNQDLLKLVIEKNNLAITEFLLKTAGIKPTPEMMNLALCNSNFDIIKLLLETNATVFSNEVISEAFEIAIDNDCNLELVKTFLKAGIKPNQNDVLGVAVSNGDYELTKLLIAHGAKADEEGLLVWAFVKEENSTLQMIELLVNAGAAVNSGGSTTYPLRLAVEEGWFGVVKFLVEHGATVNHDDNEHNLFCLAMVNKFYKIAGYLIQSNPDIVRCGGYCRPLQLLHEESIENIKLVVDHLSPGDLFFFCKESLPKFIKREDDQIIEYLLKKNMLVNNLHISTLLLKYAYETLDPKSTEFFKIAHTLIKYGANPNCLSHDVIKEYRKFWNSLLPLHMSERYRRVRTSCMQTKNSIEDEEEYHLCPENPNHVISHKAYKEGIVCSLCLAQFPEMTYINVE